ncbi:agmatinase [Paenibacillus sp. SORGH_AS306]|uniref:arginase family protein n=1 Tax=unclassified Paenibacillus TaxID=185978 RepID=UPI002784598D|nr:MULTISPECIES: arginase family protein [unclassified Paenibacillus]MDQ1235699.1 agmatinase [Paenibacillus sp. SORGH_AS_0306]MDR6112748.1 agmatinase [Paenibacillus sp. SORGH_AS_0338]
MTNIKYILEKNNRGESIISDESLEFFWTSEDISIRSKENKLTFYNIQEDVPVNAKSIHIVGVPYSSGSNHNNSSVEQFPHTLRYLSTKTPIYPSLNDLYTSGILDLNNEKILHDCVLNDLGDITFVEQSKQELESKLNTYIDHFCSTESQFSFIGGDHSITYYILKQLKENGKNIIYIHFDAHLDCGSDPLRLDVEVDHGNFVRHLIQDQIVEHVVQLGVRGLRSLGQYYEHTNLSYISSQKLNVNSVKKAIEPLLNKNSYFYISFDVDVLDPTIFPYVDFPSSGGASIEQIFEVLQMFQSVPNIIGFDVVEGQGANTDHIPYQYDVIINIFSQLLNVLNKSKNIINGGE